MRRASHIARSTLSLYRESAAPVAVELGPLIGSVVDLQQGELNQRRLRVEQRVRAMETIEAYPSELRQIIINLMQNAVAASGPGSRIFVRAQARNGGCSITIADQGAGVAPDHRSRLFSLFFTTKGDEGTGLGLWLVQFAGREARRQDPVPQPDGGGVAVRDARNPVQHMAASLPDGPGRSRQGSLSGVSAALRAAQYVYSLVAVV